MKTNFIKIQDVVINLANVANIRPLNEDGKYYIKFTFNYVRISWEADSYDACVYADYATKEERDEAFEKLQSLLEVVKL